jgi:hypothetical protein
MRHALRLSLAIALIAGCGGGGNVLVAPDNATLSLDASKWEFFYSPNMPQHPAQEGASLSFVFPLADGVHYLLTRYGGSLADKAEITFSASIAAIPPTEFTYSPNGCDYVPANARIMIQRDGDDLVADYGRWWATVGWRLQNGSIVMTVPLTPEHWSSVNGRLGDTVPDAFADALAHVGNIGLTFGGGCFFGHGAWATGPARFALTNFGVR